MTSVPDLITIPTIEDVTRRTFISGALASALLIACGGDDDKAEEPTPAATTRMIETINGSVEVPVAPQRIVCLDYISTAAVLEAGMVPVGIGQGTITSLPQYAEQVKALPDVAVKQFAEPNLELIASLNPQIILGSDWLATEKRTMPYERLTQIAPTALMEWQAAGGNWAEQATRFADAIGRGETMAGLQKQYTDRVGQIKSSYARALGSLTWDLVDGSATGQWFLYGPGSAHGKVFTDAGVRLNAAAGQQANFAAQSLENLNLLAQTDIVGFGDGPNAVALREEPLFQSLKAAQTKHTPVFKWFFPSSFKKALALLDELEAVLKTL
jgi:iron complex transport system substrate-binding protein